MRAIARLGAPLIAATTLLTLTAPIAAHADDTTPKILLVMDASGSMNEPDPAGGTKLEAAKKALTTTINALPSSTEVGLRLYGATYPGKDKTISCKDTQLAQPITALDTAALTEKINGTTAQGDTPIAYALEQGITDLGTTGKRHIILVSDGEENCNPDPCPTIQKLTANNINLQIDTVGYGVNDTARSQLKCIANAGNGTYYDAKDADLLDSTLTRLSTRALRQFTIAGTPTTGSSSPEGAPSLTAGQYQDVFDLSSKAPRYYSIRREEAGSTLHVSLTGKSLYLDSLADSVDAGSWSLLLRTPDGEHCNFNSAAAADEADSGHVFTIMTPAIAVDPNNPEGQGCAESDTLIAEITADVSSTGSQPIEILVMEEPAVADAGSLPSGISVFPSNLTPATAGTPTPVVGGVSFNDALEVEPGTYETELIAGELLFFKMPMEYGQSAAMTVNPPAADSPAFQTKDNSYFTVAGAVYSPDRARLSTTRAGDTFYPQDDGTLREDTVKEDLPVPEILYRNRWDGPTDNITLSPVSYAMPGYYYFAISVPPRFSYVAPDEIVKARFTLTRDGEATGIEGSPTQAPSSKPTSSSSSSEPKADQGAGLGVLPIVGGSLIGLGLVGGIAYVLIRRRNRS